MSALTEKDLVALKHYATSNNRELYWNYLAQKEGNDGYGLLALGVVRNDNAPGATANAFADERARQGGVFLGERQWNEFGIDLMNTDLKMRVGQMMQGRAELALNLPVLDVLAVHDASFRSRNIHPDAWTPRELVQSALRHGGVAEAEAAWTRMLDNSVWGLTRAKTTLQDVANYSDDLGKAADYSRRMGEARLVAAVTGPTVDPDRIGTDKITEVRDPKTGRWTFEVAPSAASSLTDLQPSMVPITDPNRIRELEDVRELRLEKRQLRQQFHPDDPYRHQPVAASLPLVAAIDSSPLLTATALASFDRSQSDHPRHALHCQCRDGVQVLAASPGMTLDDGARARLTASLTGLAAGSGIDRVDHVVVGRGSGDGREGPHVFVVQGNLRDPAHQRAQMPLDQAITTPVEASHRELAAVDQRQAVQLQQAQQQTAAAPQIDEPHRVHSRV